MRAYWTSIIVAVAITIALVAPDLVHYEREERNIATVAAGVAGGYRTPREKALAISAAVRARIRPVEHGTFYDVDHLPLFRYSAWQTWIHREGHCGDGARVIVLMLLSQGIRASRIELNSPPDYSHVAVIYSDQGQWYLVDSINSSPEFHAWITSKPRRFDARFSNPFFASYTFFNWSRLIGRRLAFNQLSPLPTSLVVLTENPPLMVAAVKLAGISTFFGLILLWSRRRANKAGTAPFVAKPGSLPEKRADAPPESGRESPVRHHP